MSLINDLVQRIKGATQEPCFYHRIPGDHVLDEGATREVIVPGSSYFEIRLSEMFLRNKRQYWFEFVPFTLVVTEFLFDDAMSIARRESAPFLVNNQLLSSIEHYVGNNQVEYRNARVAGPVPYMGDDVDLFVALYRAKVSDLSEKLFDFLGNMVGVFEVSGISTYLEMGRRLGEGLSGLLGIEDIEYRLGTRDSFTDKPGDPGAFKECYLAYINCPETAVTTNDLWVKDHRLHVGSRKANKPFRDYDYCLIRIDQRTTRNYESLPFYTLWKQAENSISHDNLREADAMFAFFAREVARSPDLTKDDRTRVQLIYKVNLEEAIRHQNELRSRPTVKAVPPERGPKTGLSAKAVFQMTADVAKKAGVSREVQKGLREVAKHWDKIPYLKERSEGFKLNDDILKAQLDALSSVTQIGDINPEDLSKAFMAETLDAR